MDNAYYTHCVARVAKIAAEKTASLSYGMWNPDYCKADSSANDVHDFILRIQNELSLMREAMARKDTKVG